jgi:hypothetical protein
MDALKGIVEGLGEARFLVKDPVALNLKDLAKTVGV